MPVSKRNRKESKYINKVNVDQLKKRKQPSYMYIRNAEGDESSEFQENQKDISIIKDEIKDKKNILQKSDYDFFNNVSQQFKMDSDSHNDLSKSQIRVSNHYDQNYNGNSNNLNIIPISKGSQIDHKKINQDKLNKFYNKYNKSEKIFFQLLEQQDQYTNMLEKIVSDNGMGDISCLVCLQLPLVPLKCLSCKMMVCAKCAFEWVQKKDECPYGCVGSWNLSKPSENELNSILQQHFYCEYQKFGCGQTNKIQDVIPHEQNCKHKAIPCQFCKNLVVQRDMTNHELICEYRICKCKKCTFTYIAKDKKIHNCIKTVLSHYQKLQSEFKQYRLDTEEKLENIDKQVKEAVERNKSRSRLYYPEYSRNSNKLHENSQLQSLSSASQVAPIQQPQSFLSKNPLIKQNNPLLFSDYLSNQPSVLKQKDQLSEQKASTILNLQNDNIKNNHNNLDQSQFLDNLSLPVSQNQKLPMINYPSSLQNAYRFNTFPSMIYPSEQYLMPMAPFQSPYSIIPSNQYEQKINPLEIKSQLEELNKKTNEISDNLNSLKVDKNQEEINKNQQLDKNSQFCYQLDEQINNYPFYDCQYQELDAINFFEEPKM